MRKLHGKHRRKQGSALKDLVIRILEDMPNIQSTNVSDRLGLLGRRKIRIVPNGTSVTLKVFEGDGGYLVQAQVKDISSARQAAADLKQTLIQLMPQGGVPIFG